MSLIRVTVAKYNSICVSVFKVHFSFSDTGPEFHMPPPCSVVIQVNITNLFSMLYTSPLIDGYG